MSGRLRLVEEQTTMVWELTMAVQKLTAGEGDDGGNMGDDG